MTLPLQDTFRKISDQKYVFIQRQVAFAIMGGIGLCITLFGCINYILKLSNEFGFSVSYLIGFGVIFIITGSMFLLFISMGLMNTTTEIDFATRTVRITRRNIRGARATWEASLDNISISAVRMGVSPAAPHGAWIVRAGFIFEEENGEEVSIAIWSKEVDKEQNTKERNEIMFELYRFFFPDRPPVSEANLITNGNVVMLLSDKEIEEFKKKAEEPVVFEDKKQSLLYSEDKSKFDNLV